MSGETTHQEFQYWCDMQYKAEAEMEILKESRKQQLVRNLNAVLSKDGNQFCWLIGEDLVQGIAGFGDTVALALDDLWDQYNNYSAKPKEPTNDL